MRSPSGTKDGEPTQDSPQYGSCLSGELPQYDPKEPPKWVTRLMNKIGDRKDDFAEDWRRSRAEQEASSKEDERTVDPDSLKRS